MRKEDVIRVAHDPAHGDRLYLNRYVVLQTSGTTGKVGYFLHDLAAWSATRPLLLARAPRSVKIRSFFYRIASGRTRVATFCATQGPFGLRAIFSLHAPGWENVFIRKEAFEITDPLPEHIRRLNEFRPHVLAGYASILAELAREQRDGRLRIAPELVGTGAEPLTPERRAEIARAFSATIVDVYGATEAIGIAAESDCGNLHLVEDACVLEPVDEQGRPVGEGAWGNKVYVTNLLNRVMPIIRYELADRVRFIPGGCTCGSPFTRIEIQGRPDDTLVLPGTEGRTVRVAPIPLIALLLEVPGIRESQVIQETDSRVRILLVPESPGPEEPIRQTVEARFTRYLRQSGASEAVTVGVECVRALERMPGGGKIRQIWNRSKGTEA